MDYKKAVKDYLEKNKEKLMNGNPQMSPTLGSDKQGLQMLANKASGLPGAPILPGVPPRPGQMPPPSDGRTIKGYDEGGIVESLKHLFSGDKKEASQADSIDPVVQTSSPTAQGYAQGGILPPNTPHYDDGTESVPPPQFDPNAGMPPVPPPAAPVANSPVMPDNSIQDYITQQKAQQTQYGPEQQLAVSKALLGQQNGIGGRLANAGTGLADAVMQGVSRAGNPGFQANLQNRQNQQAQMQMEALKGARGANTENLQANQRLDAMDPTSALSRAKQTSNGPILTAMGFDPKTVQNMSAAEMENALSLLQTFRGKELETAVAKYKAQIEANQLAETSRHNASEEGLKSKELAQTAANQKAEQGLKGQEIQTGELEKAANVPLTTRIGNFLSGNKAANELQNQALAHPDDDKAIAWANANPNDPRAIKIKQLHGIQ